VIVDLGCAQINCHAYKSRVNDLIVVVYSCFEKDCPVKPYATMPKGTMGNWGSWYLIEAVGVSAT